MSGLFKNFDRLIAASNLSNPNHKYLLRSQFFSFSPAVAYFKQNEVLKPGHGRDIFELSLLSYKMTKQNLVHKEWLENLSEEEHTNFYNEILEKSEQNARFISDSINEIQLQLDVGIQDVPVSALTSFAYTLGQSKSVQSTQLFNTYIKPQILEKIHYTSQQDLIDLVSGLTNLNITDSALWTKIQQQLESRTFEWQHNEVAHHAWEVTTYESLEKPVCNYYSNRLTHTEQYYQDIVSGRGGPLAELKRKALWAFDELQFRFINPFFLREYRGEAFFYQFNSEAEKESLLSNLKVAAEKVPQAKSALQTISNRF